MAHKEHTSQEWHRKHPATKSRTERRFSSSRYLEELLAEVDRAAISLRLQESRELAGLTQAEMAEILHVHLNTVQNWESPRKRTIPASTTGPRSRTRRSSGS